MRLVNNFLNLPKPFIMSPTAVLSFFYSRTLVTYVASQWKKVRFACILDTENGWKPFLTAAQRGKATGRLSGRAPPELGPRSLLRPEQRHNSAPGSASLPSARRFPARPAPPGAHSQSGPGGAPPTQVLQPWRVCSRRETEAGNVPVSSFLPQSTPTNRKAAEPS